MAGLHQRDNGCSVRAGRSNSCSYLKVVCCSFHIQLSCATRAHGGRVMHVELLSRASGTPGSLLLCTGWLTRLQLIRPHGIADLPTCIGRKLPVCSRIGIGIHRRPNAAAEAAEACHCRCAASSSTTWERALRREAMTSLQRLLSKPRPRPPHLQHPSQRNQRKRSPRRWAGTEQQTVTGCVANAV